MNEFELIARLTPTLPGNASVIVGSGDDCAILEAGWADQVLLFKTDAVVEGVHFTKETPAGKIGRKALARCLSDIAAMAGTPVSALVTLGLPQPVDVSRIEAIYAGMEALAREHGVAIVGGETSASPNAFWMSVAMTGTATRGKSPLRSGARAGDAIFVTGRLGGSLLGRHLEFEPRLIEARWLVEHFAINAMMDLSDGLAGDLRHILNASGCGAEIRAASVPISREAKLHARSGSMAKPPLAAALTDGEDFELLFTLPARQAVSLLDTWKSRFPGLPLTCVGKITSEPGLRLRDKHGVRVLAANGYVHLA
jgi:thiamine-monophosphate kinase